jgi:hypothetical protein
MVIESRACPRCEGDLYQRGDHFGGYSSCLICGYHKDVASPDDIDATDRLPYIGINLKWDHLVTSYTEVFNSKQHSVTKIISCPFSKNNKLCRQDMEKSGRLVSRYVRKGNTVQQKKMHEYQCPRGHSIGISLNGFTSWA